MNDKQKGWLAIGATALALLALLFFGLRFLDGEDQGFKAGQISAEGRALVEEYVRAHISELSPKGEVLGGKFYVTKIVFGEGNTAVVEYEDGHIALKASFKYLVNARGEVVIDSFTLME